MSLAERYALTPAEEVARRLGVSEEAVALTRDAEVIDLHLESYIPPRLWGYDLHERHDQHWLRGHLFGHLDFPRALDGGLSGAMWSIATNILRTAEGRYAALRRNVAGLVQEIEASEGRLRVARSYAEYREVREAGAHAALISVQGGNALEAAPEGPASIPDRLLTRVTVMHLSNSVYGATSSPASFAEAGLTPAGKTLVEQLNAERVFVDLAHIDKKGFWDAHALHDKSQPLIVTHTGVEGVTPHWRNLDDDQLRAVADTGGTIGIIFERSFLRRAGGPRDDRMVMEHIDHAVRVAGEDAVALGSDYDGFIIPPKELRDGFEAYYRLTQRMLEAGYTETRIRKILGSNFLRSFKEIRPQ